jgi:hypothetical protein
MAFISWATELARAKEALANRTWDQYFISRIENHREMGTAYTKLENVVKFIEWLEQKAAEESMSINAGEIPFSVGGSWS